MTSHLKSLLLDALVPWISWKHEKVMIFDGRCEIFEKKYSFRCRGATVTSSCPDTFARTFWKALKIQLKPSLLSELVSHTHRINIYKRHVCPGSNTDAQAEAALSLRMCLDGFLTGWLIFFIPRALGQRDTWFGGEGMKSCYFSKKCVNLWQKLWF